MPIRFVVVSTALLCTSADGLIRSAPGRARIDRRRSNRRLVAINEDADSSHRPSHRWKHEPFDFSSKVGWDAFYQNGLTNDGDSASTSIDTGDGRVDEEVAVLEYEWHPTIPHSTVVDAIRPAISTASKYYAQQQSTLSAMRRLPSILLVGCGNSALPRVLHDSFDTPVQVTCLDYSPVCIEMIRSMYEASCPHMNFVVGDATRLQEVVWDEDSVPFDIVVDKGLLDALMCGEGFDLEQLMKSTDSVLTDGEWGMHVLICFQLSKASKQSLAELGRNSEPGLAWDFDIPVEGTENGRARFNLARRSTGQSAGVVGVNHITTEWI